MMLQSVTYITAILLLLCVATASYARTLHVEPINDSMPDGSNGVYIGKLSTLQYEVSGLVYAIDEETILIKDFHYNGNGPDAYFYIGTSSSSPDTTGQIIPYPQDVSTQSPTKVLPRIWGEDITLHIPQGIKISHNLKWLSIWCNQYNVDFGNVLVPRDLQIPKKFVPEPVSQVPMEVVPETVSQVPTEVVPEPISQIPKEVDPEPISQIPKEVVPEPESQIPK